MGFLLWFVSARWSMFNWLAVPLIILQNMQAAIVVLSVVLNAVAGVT